MSSALLMNLLARTVYGRPPRQIYGKTTQPNKTVGCHFNVTWTCTQNPNTGNWEWSASGGTTINATSDANGDYSIIIPDNFVIENFTFDNNYGAPNDNVTYIDTINLSYIGDVSNLTMLNFAFGSLTHVTSIAGFNKFLHCQIKTIEGCFRSCERLTSLDLTGLNTDYMIKVDGATDGRQRYGFPNCFYHCSSMTHLVLPKIPSTCYMGSSAFSGCSALTDISCSDVVQNDLILGDIPLTLTSMRDILSHLDSIHATNAKCEFNTTSWINACQDFACQGYIATAKSNGWDLPANILYFDYCTSNAKFNSTVAKGYYLVGIEDSNYSHANSLEIGQTYIICNEPKYDTTPFTHDYIEYRFGSNIDLTNASAVELVLRPFNYTSTSGGDGLERLGKNTNTSQTTTVLTNNNNMPISIQIVDYNDNTSAWITDDSSTTLNPDSVSGTQKSPYTLKFSIASIMSSLDKTRIKGINIMHMLSADSDKARKKGVWYNLISIKE